MQIAKNIKSLVKYNGHSSIIKIENNLLNMGRLFAAKLESGYRLFQDAGKVFVHLENGEINGFHYVIYYERLFQEIPIDFTFLQNEKYFYLKLDPNSSDRDLEQYIGSNGEHSEFFGGSIYYFDLGIKKLPSDITPQRYFRDFEWNQYSNKIRLFLFDVFCLELFEYKQETPEYLAFSSAPGGLVDVSIHSNLKYIEDGFGQWNLERIQKYAEECYMKNPFLRPINETFEALRKNLPTKKFKEYLVNTDEIKINKQIEELLISFANGLDDQGKLTINEAKKLTKELVLKLNNINAKTQFIETIECEDLYNYIAKLLAKRKKVEAIKIIDELREW